MQLALCPPRFESGHVPVGVATKSTPGLQPVAQKEPPGMSGADVKTDGPRPGATEGFLSLHAGFDTPAVHCQKATPGTFVPGAATEGFLKGIVSIHSLGGKCLR